MRRVFPNLRIVPAFIIDIFARKLKIGGNLNGGESIASSPDHFIPNYFSDYRLVEILTNVDRCFTDIYFVAFDAFNLSNIDYGRFVYF